MMFASPHSSPVEIHDGFRKAFAAESFLAAAPPTPGMCSNFAFVN